MRRLRSVWVLATMLVAVPSIAAGAVMKAASSHRAAPGGVIVFASDRAKFEPGEIYSLAPGARPLNVSRSLAGEYGLAVAPVGDLIAFWSARTGTDRVYLARSDGSRLRLVRAVGGNLFSRSRGGGGALTFSADGLHLYADSYDPQSGFLADTRSATARSAPACSGIARPSADLTLFACGVNRTTTVRDLAGHVRFTLPGITAFWSSRGWVTSAPGAGDDRQAGAVAVADPSGTVRARVKGVPLGWSPDGRWLVLGRRQELWVAGPDDFRRARRLLADWPGGLVSFAPDGRSISTESSHGAVLIPLAGGPPVKGLDRGNGVWSRAGRLAYVGYDELFARGVRPGVKVSVFVTDTHGRNPHVVGRFPYDDHGQAALQWLPDGRRVLFLTSTSCGGNGLFAVPADGGPTLRLDHDPRNLETPTWSPDGTRIAVSVQDFSCHLGAGLPSHIATLAPDGSDPRRLTDDGDQQLGSFDRFPSFSPDGARIAFAHGTFTESTIQIASARGGGKRTSPLPPDDGVAAEPVWSPDGSRIAYGDGRAIRAVAPDGGTPELIARDLPMVSCGSGGLAWSPDGKQIAVGRGSGIYLITVGEPASVRLAIRAPCAGNPSFSPDGKRIAFDARPPQPLGEQTAIMVARVDGTAIRTLSTVPFRESLHPSWQPAP